MKQISERQHFTIGHDAWEAASQEEVDKTVAGLKELGLYALPFPVVDVDILLDDVAMWVDDDRKPKTIPGEIENGRSHLGPNVVMRVTGLTAEEGVPIDCRALDFQTGYKGDCNDYIVEATRKTICDLLICLLATRNVEKAFHENKLFKLGIGKPGLRPTRAYRYTTSISVPGQLIDDEGEHKPTGLKKAAHLRRGHIRRQHYGPSNQFEKKIWIDPVFVNADSDFVAKRERYNLSVRK